MKTAMNSEEAAASDIVGAIRRPEFSTTYRRQQWELRYVYQRDGNYTARIYDANWRVDCQ